jgi:hypothetical protein
VMAAPARARAAARPVTRQAAPLRQPRPAEPRRLQLVTDARLRDATRQRRMRALMVAVGVIVLGALFALAAFNAVLVSGQARLDQLQKDVAEAQSRYSTNRLKVAQLEAPEHVVQVAQERLGMVPPPHVTYLTPSQAMADEVGHTSPDPAPASREDAGGASWAAVKPYLAGRP